MAVPRAINLHRRKADVLSAVRIELVTVVWMTAEAIIGIGAGILARSVLLTAFGIDSVIELVSAAALLWRLNVEAQGGSVERVEHVEHQATWITGVGLALLCIYVVGTSMVSLVAQNKPAASAVGLGLGLAAAVIMPALVWRKRTIASRIASSALRADAACSLTCAYMAATLLIGVAFNVAFHWWWADAVAALALLYWLVPETREALQNARAGRVGCACPDDPSKG